ncbi:helix-turn-helix domain-containing protein [Gryllotalpicola reticulitermitis]|uniref:Helix-turn-helix domain-containing protein n=1 Tax=Gryllotalpicola reticulitermitis TaxID=1184153 RepID=A0ABV8Q7N9_9MICO
MVTKSRMLEADLRALGLHLAQWRKVRGLTAQMVAERAGITRATLRGIENGTGAQRWDSIMAVMRVLDVARLVVDATDPLSTDVGRANAERILPTRVIPGRTSR